MSRYLRRFAVLSLFVATAFAPGASFLSAAEGEKGSLPAAPDYRPVPLDAWKSLPVFDSGRIKPLDSYANQIVERVTGSSKSSVAVGLADHLDLGAQKFVCDGREAFVLDGQERTFTPGELIASWILESDKWRDVPCIAVPESLQSKLATEEGFASPAALDEAARKAFAGDFAKLEKEGLDAEGVSEDVKTLFTRRETLNRWAVDAARHADAYRAAFELFPLDENLKLSPEEIVLSWLAEPDRWEAVPFLPATHFKLRELLGVREKNDRGLQLKYVSPLDVANSDGLSRYLQDRFERQRTERRDFQETADDERVSALLGSYAAYREISNDPTASLQYGPIPLVGNRGKYVATLEEALTLIQEKNARGQSMADMLKLLAQFESDAGFASSAQSFFDAFPAVFEVYDALTTQSQTVVSQGVSANEALEEYPMPMAQAEAATIAFRDAVDRLADFFREQKNKIYDLDTASEEQRKSIGPIFRELSAKADELKRLARELEKALYDQEQMVHILPDLDPYALAKDREAEARNLPWVSLQAVLHAQRMLDDYPDETLNALRKDWRRLVEIYRDRTEPQRAERFGEAMTAFRTRLAALGRAVESRRENLVEATLTDEQIDQSLIEYTRYPEQTRKLDLEVQYNELQPFKWSFVLSLVALLAFCLSFGKLRAPMFWGGVGLLFAVALWTTYAFYLRVSITGWAPVTNMFETIVFVPFVVCVMGLWFLLSPAIWPGVRDSWRMTALPFTWEEGSLTLEQERRFSPVVWKAFSWLSAVGRVALMGVVLYHLAFAPHADGKRAVFPLLPTVSEGTVAEAGAATVRWASSFNDWFVWGLGIVCLAAAMWWVPRLLMTAAYSLVMGPYDLLSDRASWGRRGRECLGRYPFALAAAGACAFFFSVAQYRGGVDESFSPLQPVLRSNYWLTIHVLTIVASYGAGMLAWTLGLVALAYYLFGKYERITASKSIDLAPGEKLRRPGDLPTGPTAMPTTESSAVGGEFAEPSSSGGAVLTQADVQEGFVHVRAPEACRTLAGYCYRAIQVACVLLAAGTILGGLWADVSWGRFWGWDPKEVWALISFLVYIAILHGRFAGYFNSFGLVFGTIAGASMIAMSWYGVNFALPTLAGGNVGLHSYGSGSGGLWKVALIVVANWAFLGAAGARYWMETSANRKPPAE